MRTLFNEGWEFAETPLDTSYLEIAGDAWEAVTLPHDFLITDVRALYRDATGWYRKIFTLRETGMHLCSRLFLNFDGVYMDSRVYLNGVAVGEWKYGYSSFTIELTEHIRREGENELLVSVRHQAPNSRWYSGAGIFRDVTLIGGGETFIPENGVYFHAEPEAGADREAALRDRGTGAQGRTDKPVPQAGTGFEITVRTELDGRYAQEARVRQMLVGPDGESISLQPVFKAELVTDGAYIQGSGGGTVFSRRFIDRKRKSLRVIEQRYQVTGIRRWDITDPVLYTLRT